MRRHPILFGLFLVFILGVLISLFAFSLSFFGGERGAGFTVGEDRIGVVNIKGVITDSKTAVDQISKYSDDPGIKSIIVRIDSPGGGVAASQEIYQSILTAKTKKKIVASLGSVAASGGYYIACASDRIVSNPGTVTGSIGAIMHFTNVEETMKKIGLRASAVKSGRYKDIGSPLRDMTPDERALMQGVIDDIYDQFIDAVSANRKIQKEKLKEYADGRIFTGRQALQLGLVDVLGDMDSAVKTAARLAGIKGKPEVVYPKEKGFSIWKYLVEETKTAIMSELSQRAAGGVFYLTGNWRIEY